MNKVRIGNDFVFLWQIKRGGVVEDLMNVSNLKLVRYINAFGYEGAGVECEPQTGGILRVEVTPEMAPKVGKYFFELSYELVDLSLSDNDRKCKVDVDAFQIVSRTSLAEEIYEIAVTSDLLIGLRGEAFKYEWFTPLQLESLVGPRGPKGDSFTIDAQGLSAERANYNDAPRTFSFLDVEAGLLYFKLSDAFNHWSTPVPFGQGPKGDPFTFADFKPEELALLKGDKGEKGDTGLQGEQGIQGERGLQGVQGEKGEKGDTGEKGVQGEPGIQGERGLQGEQGPSGLTQSLRYSEGWLQSSLDGVTWTNLVKIDGTGPELPALPDPVITYSASPLFLGGDITAQFAKDIPYGSGAKQKFDIFIPSSATPTGLVLNFHGGYFVIGRKEDAYQKEWNPTWDQPEIIRECLRNNIAFATADYTLLNENGDTEGIIKCMNDMKYVLQYIKYFSHVFNIDKTKVIVMGDSAGAGTSLWLGFADDMAEDQSPDLILRESTKPKAITINVTQATYDLEKFETHVFQDFGFDWDTYLTVDDPGMLPLYNSIYGMSNKAEITSPRVIAYRQKIDMLGLMKADSPEFWVDNTLFDVGIYPPTRDAMTHNGEHVIALKNRADALGVPNVCYWKNHLDPSGETSSAFIIRKINESAPSTDLTIASVEVLSDVTVANGTDLTTELPTSVNVVLSDNSSLLMGVVWNISIPPYDKTTVGTYAYTGDITLTEGIINPGYLRATRNIIVSGTISPKQEFINLHTPNVGTNLIKDSMFLGEIHRGSELPTPLTLWRDPINAVSVENNIMTIDAKKDAQPMQNILGLTVGQTLTVSFRYKLNGLNAPQGQGGFAMNCIGGSYDPYSDIKNGTSDWEVFTKTFNVTSTTFTFSVLTAGNTAGTVEFEKPMLNIGSTPLPHAFNSEQELLDYADILYP